MLLDPKFFDQTYNMPNLTSAGTINTWGYGCIMGTSVNQRVGQKIKINEFNAKVLVSDSAQTRVRVIFFFDRMPGGAAPSKGDIMNGSGIDESYNHYNVIGSGGSRFQILDDRRINVQPLFSGATRCYNYSLSKKGLKTIVRFDSNAGTVSDIVANNIGVLAWSDGTTADVSFTSYYKYTDT